MPILITISKALNISPTNNTLKTSLIESDTINLEKENTNNLESKITEFYSK
jgi:hypothetical protein